MSQPSGHPHPSEPTPGSPPQPGGYPPAQGGFPTPGQAAQDGFPAPGQPHPAPPAPRKSKAGRIVLIVLAVVLVLCAAGAGITWFVVKDEVTEAVDATRTRLVAPETLAGRPKLTEPELQALTDQMVREMKSSVQNETSAVGAFYGDPAKQDLVMIAGASGLMADPKKELDDAIAGLSAELTVSGMKQVEPGPLGGEARCGDGRTDEVPLGVCVWADKGSLGMIVMFFKTGAQAETELVTIRDQVQQRS